MAINIVGLSVGQMFDPFFAVMGSAPGLLAGTGVISGIMNFWYDDHEPHHGLWVVVEFRDSETDTPVEVDATAIMEVGGTASFPPISIRQAGIAGVTADNQVTPSLRETFIPVPGFGETGDDEYIPVTIPIRKKSKVGLYIEGACANSFSSMNPYPGVQPAGFPMMIRSLRFEDVTVAMDIRGVIVSDDFPDVVATGASGSFALEFENTGSDDWPDGVVGLHCYGDSDLFGFEGRYVFESGLPSGERASVSLPVSVVAPPGVYNIFIDLVKDGDVIAPGVYTITTEVVEPPTPPTLSEEDYRRPGRKIMAKEGAM